MSIACPWSGGALKCGLPYAFAHLHVVGRPAIALNPALESFQAFVAAVPVFFGRGEARTQQSRVQTVDPYGPMECMCACFQHATIALSQLQRQGLVARCTHVELGRLASLTQNAGGEQ